MNYGILSRSPFFRGLAENEIASLLSAVTFRVKSFVQGEIAAVSGEKIASVMIVLSGSMRGEMTDVSGRVIKIEDINPPQALAAAFIYGERAVYPVNVTANSITELLVIDRLDFLSLMQKDRRVLQNYLNVVCTKAVFLSDRLRFLSFHTIKGKYAHYLLGLHGSGEGKVTADRTQQELADYFGVTRPSLARAVGEMQDDGIILVSRRNVSILNRAELVRLTGGA